MPHVKKIAINISKYTLCLIFALYFLVWISSPFVSAYALSQVLAEFDVQLSEDSSIRYNPFKTLISIDSLSLLKDGHTVFSLEKAELEIDLYRLFADELHIDQLEFSKLKIEIEQNGSKTTIAGIELPENKSTNESESTSDSELPFRITSNKIKFESHTIVVIRDGTPIEFEIKDLSIPPISITTNEQTLSPRINAKIFGGTLDIASDISVVNGHSTIHSLVKINQLQLSKFKHFLPENLSILDGKMDLTLETTLEISDTAINISGKDSAFTLTALETQYDNLKLSLDSNDFRVASFNKSFTDGAMSSSDANFENTLSNLHIKDANTENTLVSMNSATFSGVNLTTTQDIQNTLETKIQNIHFNELHASQVTTKEKERLPSLFSFKSLSLESIQANLSNTTIENIHLQDFSTNVFIDKEKNILTLANFNGDSSSNSEASKKNASTKSTISNDIENENVSSNKAAQTSGEDSEITENESPTKDYSFSISSILVDGDNTITLKDDSVSPRVSQKVTLDTFTLDNFSNTDSSPSRYTLTGRHNNHGKFKSEGDINLFTEKLNANITGEITEIALPTLSAYIHEPLGFGLTSGQLDSFFDVKIQESNLNGAVNFKMRGLEMSKNETYDKTNLKGQTAVPLNVALGMLKDKRGNIKLKVPLSGSVEDPSFGVQSFLLLVTKKAILSQTKSYLINTFVPYANVVSVAMIAGDFALKLRFEDMIYEPGSTEISEKNLVFTQQFIQLMKDKPDTQIKVCGIATPKDLVPTAGEKTDTTQKESSLEKVISEEDFSEERREKLREIASTRAEAFKAYVIENGEIPSSRLLVCAPKIEFDEKSKPRLKLSI